MTRAGSLIWLTAATFGIAVGVPLGIALEQALK
jgi:hypothetical protein